MKTTFKVLKDYYYITWAKIDKGQKIENTIDDPFIKELFIKGYIKEIKEEENPKFKIWDYAVEEPFNNNLDETEYLIIYSVLKKDWKFIYNMQYSKNWYVSFLSENKIRKPTKEELELYFN